MACFMSRLVEADREADIEVDEDEQICSTYHNKLPTGLTLVLSLDTAMLTMLEIWTLGGPPPAISSFCTEAASRG